MQQRDSESISREKNTVVCLGGLQRDGESILHQKTLLFLDGYNVTVRASCKIVDLSFKFMIKQDTAKSCGE